MSIRLHLDRERRSVPLYRQIIEQVIHRIEEGYLPQGSRLPTVRALAQDVGVTRVTVHQAYAELKANGWIEATVGRGTFVRGPTVSLAAAETLTEPSTPERVLAEIARLGRDPAIRSLAVAEADPALYPALELMRTIESLDRRAGDLFRYGSAQGDLLLRGELSALVEQRGIEARPDDILVTTGVTQGLALVTDVLCRPGDKVVVENPTYLGFLGLLESHSLTPLPVPLDAEGLRIDVLDQILAREKPRFLYTVPSFQNPTGISMSEKRRKDVLSLAKRHDLTIVEDDIYSRLRYEGELPPALKALDHDEHVVYLDGFSKALVPGMRVGFLIPPSRLRERFLSWLQVRELCGVSLLQCVLAELLQKGLFRAHLKRVLPAYKRRRDALLRSLERHMPPGARWTRPSGGYSAWLSLPSGSRTADLYRRALRRGVIFAPGEVFTVGHPEGHHEHHLRLCFGALAEKEIAESVAVLGELVQSPARRTTREQMSDLKPIA